MDWSWLLLLVCPLMMLVMMKGMLGNHHKHSQQDNNEIEGLRQQIIDLNLQVEDMKSKSKTV